MKVINMPRGMLITLETMSDEELVVALDRAVAAEVTALVELLKHLAEFGRRQLWLPRAYTSLFAYCTEELGYSEDQAAKRIHAARAARDFPLIYQLLEQRHVHLSAVVKLAPHLTRENHRELLWKAAGRTRLEIEAIVACLAPRQPQRDAVKIIAAEPQARLPIVPASQRPAPAPEAPSAAVAAPAVAPRAVESAPQPTLVRFSFTGTGELLKKIERAKAVMRHKFPRAELGEIVDAAMEALLDAKDRDRISARRERRRARRQARSP
jgi:hypothetical protein